MNDILSFAIQLARQAGDALLQYFQTSALQTELKNDRSAVTQADIAVDQLIATIIRTQYPSDLLLSEELQPTYPPDVSHKSKVVWIVDPLDGTTNFSLGLHFWGVLLARLVNGWPDTAVLYFPLINELYYAQKGQGAYLNEYAIKVQPPDKERPFSFFACCSRTFRHYQVSVPYKTRILGSAAYSLASVARGIALLGFEATPKIWDIAAPWLLVQEAGGVIETLDGSHPFPLQTSLDYSTYSFPTIAAATQQLATRAHLQIIPRQQA